MFVGILFQILAPLYTKLFMYMSLCFPLGRERLLLAEVLVSLEWLSCRYLNISDIYTGARPFRLLYIIQAFLYATLSLKGIQFRDLNISLLGV